MLPSFETSAGGRTTRTRRAPWPGSSRARSSSTYATPSRLGGVPPGEGARGRTQRARRAVRRHRPGGLVAVRRADQHAHDGPAGRGRPDVLPVAHHGPVLADPVDVPHRAQPPPERVRHDLGVVDRVPGLQLAHPADQRDDGQRPARGGLEHLLGRQEPQRPGRRVDDGVVEEAVAAGSGLRPVLRLHRRRDQQLVSLAGRGQQVHRPALRPRGRLPPVEGPRRPGAADDPRHQADRAGQAVVPVVLPGRQPRAAPRARRSTSTSTRGCSTTATRPTASGCCRG